METYLNNLISQVSFGIQVAEYFVAPEINNAINNINNLLNNLNPTTIEHTIPGNYVITVPANISMMYVTMCGGGGGGGAGPGSTSGGGGGACVIGYPIKVSPGQMWNVTVGDGGAAETDGGDTILDSGLTFKIECKGGKKGVTQMSGVTAVGGNGGSLIIQGTTVRAGGNGGIGFGIVGDPGLETKFGFAGAGGGPANGVGWEFQGGESGFYAGGFGNGGKGGGGASAFNVGSPGNNTLAITGIGTGGGGGDGAGFAYPNGGVGYFKVIFKQTTTLNM